MEGLSPVEEKRSRHHYVPEEVYDKMGEMAEVFVGTRQTKDVNIISSGASFEGRSTTAVEREAYPAVAYAFMQDVLEGPVPIR